MNLLSSLLIVFPLVGCSPRTTPRICIESMHVRKTMTLRSRTFQNGGSIPLANSSYGDDITPDLEWSQVPAKTQSLVLIVEDPDAPNGTFVHWTLYAIPAELRGLKAGLPTDRGSIAEGAQGENGMGGLGYFGPKPPDDKAHHYHFQIFALNSRLRPRPGLPINTLYAAIHDLAIAGADLVGTFKKPR